jgi:MFS family permease
MNGLLAMPIFVKAIDDPDANKLGIITASYALGSIIGIPLVPIVSDRFGRRMAIAIGAVLIIIGAVVQTFTKGGYDMLAGRLVVGIGAAFQGIASPAYVSGESLTTRLPMKT